LLLEAHGREIVIKSSVCESDKWFKKAGSQNVEDDERYGCPKSKETDENVETVPNLDH
jgi:hypothetical protein